MSDIISQEFTKPIKNVDTNDIYITDFVEIDSSKRNKVPEVITDKEIVLDKDPLSFTLDSGEITIHWPDHDCTNTNQIQLLNVPSKATTINYPFELDDSDGTTKLKIVYTHGLSSTAEVEVIISNVVATTSNMFHNIPLNKINTKHTVVLTPFNAGYFFITLDTTFAKQVVAPSPTYIIGLRFLSIAGISTAKINSGFPINQYQLQGFHHIHRIPDDTDAEPRKSKDELVILVDGEASQTIKTGGYGVVAQKINKINSGYPDSASYIYELPKPFDRIVAVRISSSIFPNINNVIHSSASKLYWEDLDDGDTSYDITIPEGIYTASTLADEIEKESETVARTSSSYHRLCTTIDEDINLTTFKMYTVHVLASGTDLINSAPALYAVECEVILNIGFDPVLTVGSTIMVEGAISHEYIPDSALNSTLEVTASTTSLTTVKLPIFDALDPEANDTAGGKNFASYTTIKIIVPTNFRLRFDQTDTFGSMIGYRKVGEEEAITEYGTTITNDIIYPGEVSLDEIGKVKTIKRGLVRLARIPYFWISINPFDIIHIPGVSVSGSREVISALSKVNLERSSIMNLYDEHVVMTKYFSNPSNVIREIKINCYQPDGSLMDFYDQDHHMILEIVHLSRMIKGTFEASGYT
jgi:hypothetical protein